jgi:hypothetical protein
MTDQTASFSLPGYTELQWMARGGFSSVYRATQLQYNRPVAIKVLDVGLDDERSRRQYRRECDATGRLTGHPNIVTVLDSGFTPTGKPFLVMDLCPNGTMGDRLAREGPLPVADVLRTGVKICGALETAHQVGILHRDLKPANILITAYGEPALSDFGIAAVTSQMEASVTMSAMTPNHAPPEVLEGHRPTPASDVYSMASTLYALLAGRPPFAQESGHSILAFITRVLTADVPPIPRHDVPAELSQVLVQALAKAPEDRPASAALLGYELQKIQASLGIPYTEMVTRTGAAAATDWSVHTIAAAQADIGAAATAAPDPAVAGTALAAAGTPAPAPVAGGADPSVAPIAPPTPGTAPDGVPVGDRTVLRPGSDPAAGGAASSGAAGAAATVPSGPDVAPPTPDLDRVVTAGEMTMAVDRHAPVIERIEVEAPEEARSRTPLIAAIVVLVLVVAGGAFFLFGRGGDDSASTTDTSTTVTTAATTTSAAVDPTATSSASTGPTTATTGDPTDTTTDPAEGEPPAGVAARLRDADGEIVIDVSWNDPGDAKLPVLYQLLAADGSALSKISTLGGGTTSVIVTDTDTGPLTPDTTYCVAVGFINQSAKGVWAPAACTDGSTVSPTR